MVYRIENPGGFHLRMFSIMFSRFQCVSMARAVLISLKPTA
jgi:hypothetical protein